MHCDCVLLHPSPAARVIAAGDAWAGWRVQVTNKDGALFQLPQLLASMRLVPQEDVSAHLVVVAYSRPAQVPIIPPTSRPFLHRCRSYAATTCCMPPIFPESVLAHVYLLSLVIPRGLQQQ